MEKIKQFSVDDIYLFTDDEDVDFALGEVYLLAEGNNSHKNPISLDVLKRDAHTMLGKFLIAKYSDFQKDVTTHTHHPQMQRKQEAAKRMAECLIPTQSAAQMVS